MADYTVRKQSDVQWTACSKVFAAPAEATHLAIKIPKNTLVQSVRFIPTTAFSATDATVTVGFIGNNETADPDAFLVSSVIDPDALGAVSSEMGAAVAAGGKYFTYPGTITVTTDNGTAGTAGTFQIFVDYVQLKN